MAHSGQASRSLSWQLSGAEQTSRFDRAAAVAGPRSKRALGGLGAGPAECSPRALLGGLAAKPIVVEGGATLP
jgi:hypothetical protein